MRTLLLGQARENSTRCKSKMVKPFAETTLTDLYLKLLSKFILNNYAILRSITLTCLSKLQIILV